MAEEPPPSKTTLLKSKIVRGMYFPTFLNIVHLLAAQGHEEKTRRLLRGHQKITAGSNGGLVKLKQLNSNQL
jgi:hypothetical protein